MLIGFFGQKLDKINVFIANQTYEHALLSLDLFFRSHNDSVHREWAEKQQQPQA